MSADILERTAQLIIASLADFQPGMEAEFAHQIEAQLRSEFGGEMLKIRKTNLRGEALRAEIRRRFNGRNADDIADEMGVHRATVYRALCYRKP